MRRSLVLAVLLLTTVLGSSQSAAPDWTRWNWLIGTWDGSGSGKPGEGGGWFSLAPDLDHQVLVRKSHSEYPAANGRPSAVHDDLMVVYQESGAWRADYWDNEGHVIRYVAELSARQAVFTSIRRPDTPGFRLTYELEPNGEVSVVFAMAAPGSEDFKTYVSGTVHRRK